MVCSELAVTLQCLEKQYLGTVYSGKQRNIYEHIYRFIHPSTENPPALKTQSGITKTQIRGAISNSGKHYLKPAE